MESKEVFHHDYIFLGDSSLYRFSIVATVVLIAELSRAPIARSGAPWVIKLGYLCIE